MAIVLMFDSKVTALDAVIDAWIAEGTLSIILFTAPTVLDGSQTSLGDFTGPTNAGLAAVKLPVFGVAYLNVDDMAEAVAPAHTWTADGSGSLPIDIYGYALYSAAGGVHYAELRVGGPQTVGSVGQQYVVIPRLQLDTM